MLAKHNEDSRDVYGFSNCMYTLYAYALNLTRYTLSESVAGTECLWFDDFGFRVLVLGVRQNKQPFRPVLVGFAQQAMVAAWCRDWAGPARVCWGSSLLVLGFRLVLCFFSCTVSGEARCTASAKTCKT